MMMIMDPVEDSLFGTVIYRFDFWVVNHMPSFLRQGQNKIKIKNKKTECPVCTLHIEKKNSSAVGHQKE